MTKRRSLLFETRDGVQLELDPTDYMDGTILRDGYFDPDVREALKGLVKDDMVVWDVGANIGLHALTCSTFAPNATVVAFEPAPSAFNKLLKNVELNPCQVMPAGIALSSQRGYRELHVKTQGNHGLTSLRPWPDVKYDFKLTVWCDTAEELVTAGFPAPDIVKLDVEGCELDVLRGFGSLLKSNGPEAIIFEAGAEFSGKGDDPLAAFLRGESYSVEPLAFGGKTSATNYIASRF